MKKRLYLLISILLIILTQVTWGLFDTRGNNYSLLIIIVGCLCWLFIRARTRKKFYLPKLVLPLSLFAGLQIVLLIIAPIPAYGIYWITITLVSILFLLFVVDSKNIGWDARVWENAIILVAIFFVIIDLLLVFSAYVIWWKVSGSIFSQLPYSMRTPGGLLFHPNLMAGYINLIIPFALIRIFRTEGKVSKLLWTSVLALLLIEMFFTSSRGGWIALAGGIFGMLFLTYAAKLTSAISQTLLSFPRKIPQNKKYWIMAVLMVPIVIGIAPIFVRQVTMAPHGSVSDRLDIWNYSIKLISQAPIWGTGPGSMPFLFALRSDAIGGDEVYHAHNLWLQITTETGIIGLIICLWALGVIIHLCITSWKHSRPKTPERDVLIVFAGVGISLAIHNLVDYLFANLLITLYFIIIVSLLYIHASRYEHYLLNRYKAIATMIPILGLIIVGTLYSAGGFTLFTNGMKSALRNEWNVARDKICQAAEDNQTFSYFAFQCSFANGMVAFQNNDQEALNQAIKFQKNALKIDPYWYMHWANMASYEWQNGDYDQAKKHIKRAAEAAPNRAFLWLNLAVMEEHLGQIDEAHDHYQRALCLYPWYRESIIFEESSLHDSVLQSKCPNEDKSFRNNSPYLLLWDGWQAIQTNDITTAKQLIARSIQLHPQNAIAYAYTALVDQKSGQYMDAQVNIQTALFINRSSVAVLLIAAQISHEQGNYEQEIEYLSQAFEIYQRPKLSDVYYLYAYRYFNLPLDISPFLYTGLSQETINAFLYLAEHERQRGDLGRSEEILNWLERSIPDPSAKHYTLQRNFE